MSAHTPGPWTEGYLPQHRMRIVAEGGKTTICDVALWVADYSEQAANARLIAAAPELLEACKAVLPLVRNSGASGHYGDKLAIAIAKAEGR